MTLKRHLTYQDQIARLKERGLSYGNHDKVLDVLRAIGYYRFSAYTYPFRIPVLDERGKVASRQDNFRSGSTFEDALRLYEFDQRLRLLFQDALEVIEVAFCARVGYVLGKRSPDAHLKPEDLDLNFSSELTDGEKSRHQVWVKRLSKLKYQARNEDYVKHHKDSRGDQMPIWVATEFMDFGSIVRLFEMMKKEDQIEIASYFGLANDQVGLMHSWMLALNDLRNRCAHNNRVWNRISRSPKKPNARMVTSEFLHFTKLTEAQQSKLYGIASVIAYVIRKIDPQSKWPQFAKQEFSAFGVVGGMTLQNTLGFPANWQSEKLWA